MVAGFNLTIRVWRFVSIDDDVGGAQPTGTVLYSDIMARETTLMPDMVFQEQGIETEKITRFMLWPGTLAIREKDEIEVVSPPQHLKYGKKFRIVGVNDVGFHPSDPRGYIVVSTTRSEIAHQVQ